MFVHEDEIADCVKHWHGFSEDLFKEVRRSLMGVVALFFLVLLQ